MQKAFMQSGTDASAQASPVQPQSSGLIRQVPDKGSLQGLVPSMCLVADSDAPLETEAAPRQLSVRRRLSMVSETDEQEERHLGDAAVQEEDAQEIASEYLVISRQVESDFGQSLPDNVIEQQSPGQLQGTADNESGLSKYIEKQSQEQLEQMLQQQLLKQLQQQWQPQSEENNGVQGHPAGQNLDRLEMQHAAGTPNVNEATVEVQSLALITTPADDWGQSAGEEGQVSAMSVRQRMQAALQAVHAAEKAVDAAVVFRPRVE